VGVLVILLYEAPFRGDVVLGVDRFSFGNFDEI
jgi:hypothetical protein